MIRITLDLSRHCIETEIKRHHNRCISAYFRKKGTGQTLENKLEMLQDALTLFDFSYLRTAYKELSGNSIAPITLESDGRSLPILTIHGRPIDGRRHLKADNGHEK